MDVPRPVFGLSEFAVADDVHARFRLLPHHFGNGFLQAGGMRSMVVGSPALDLLQERDELGWPDETPDVRGQNPVLIAWHGFLLKSPLAFAGHRPLVAASICCCTSRLNSEGCAILSNGSGVPPVP